MSSQAIVSKKTTLAFRSMRSNQPEASDHEVQLYCKEVGEHLLYSATEHQPDLLCQKCIYRPPHMVNQDHYEKYPWLLSLHCGACNCVWHLCKFCPPPQFRTEKKGHTITGSNRNKEKEFGHHHSKYHTEKQSHRISLPTEDEVSMNYEGTNNNASIVSNKTEEQEHTIQLIERSFSNDSGISGGAEYVITEFNHPGGQTGLLTIIAKCLADSNNRNIVSLEDAILHLMLTRQFLRNTRTERAHSVEILSMINDRYQRASQQEIEVLERRIEELSERLTIHDLAAVEESMESSSTRPTQRPRHMLTLAIPTMPNDARRYLEGRNSILAQIPSPIVHALEDGYAYVEIRAALSMLLAMGLRTQFNTPSMSINGSRSCYTSQAYMEMMVELGIPPGDNTLAVALWTDGVDTGGSNKNNRGSLKVTTLTVECPSNRGIRHTFPVAIGRDSSDHSLYRQILHDELGTLSSNHQYYDGILRQPIDMRLVHLCTTCDRPEVSDLTGIGAHNGTWSSLPGIASPVVVAPPNPGRKMSAQVRRYLGSCTSCYESRMETISQPSRSCLSRQICEECCDWNLELTEYKILLEDFDFPPEENAEEEWLSAERVSFRTIREAAEHAYTKARDGNWNKKATLSYLKSRFQLNDKTATEIYNTAQNSGVGDPFDEECLPASARSSGRIELKNLIPGIMHLLFLGVAKSVLALVIDLLKKKKKHSAFHREAQKLLKDMRSLSLTFCKVWAFGSLKTPTGPWVSENCLGFTRIMKSLFSLLSYWMAETDEVTHLARRVVWSYLAVVARIMQDAYTTHLVDETECLLKLFLSHFERLDSYLRGASKKKKPKVESVGNLVYLLRLPDMMRRFGPLREYWEGSIRGEGIFRYLKPLVRRGVHNPGVPQALLSKYFADLSLTLILDGTRNDECEEDADDTGDSVDESHFLRMAKRYTDVHTYRSEAKLEERIRDGKAVSLVQCGQYFYAKCKVNSDTTLIRMDVRAGTGYTSLVTVGIGISANQQPCNNRSFHPCAAFPMESGCEEDDGECQYYMARPDWKELQSDLTWGLPGLYTQ